MLDSHSIQMLDSDLADKIARELELGGGGLDTLVIAEFINAKSQSDARVFQFANHKSRVAVDSLISWCIRHNRVLRLVPYAYYAQ